jgi:hypothetical protein
MKISAYNLPWKHSDGVDVHLCSFFNLGAKWDGGQLHTLTAFPQGKTQYLLCRMLGGPRGLSGRVRKTSTPPRFKPQIVQPVASGYAN